MLPLSRMRAGTETTARLTEPQSALEPETGPLRRCIVTRDRLPKEKMIRFVLGPEGVLAPDLAARLPGRGIWLSARADVLESARAYGTLARATARVARAPVTLPPDLAGVLKAGLTRRIGEILGFARRAGQAVAGFEKARGWLRSGRADLVLQASDGSPEERARFLLVAEAEGRGLLNSGRVLAPLRATELGRVFGRNHVVHVAVASGRLAKTLVNETGRLTGIAGPITVNMGRVEPSGANRTKRADG
jgi:uncharacterized protein